MKQAVAAGLAVAGLSAALAAPAVGQRPSLAMLDRLDHGNWELRYRGEGGAAKHLCLADGRKLIQLRHSSVRCDSVVVRDGEAEVTVQYTCPGHGYGRTHIRRESSSLVQIQSQGIADGLPFAFSAEARRVGDCGN